MGQVSVGTAGTDYRGILARDLFGLKSRTVNGYKSSNDINLAMERGEVQSAFANGWSSIPQRRSGMDPRWQDPHHRAARLSTAARELP